MGKLNIDKKMKITLLELGDDLVDKFPRLSETKILRPLLTSVFTILKDRLQKGHSIHIRGFGVFLTVRHKEKRVKNNFDGSIKTTVPKRVAKLRVSPHLIKKLNNHD